MRELEEVGGAIGGGKDGRSVSPGSKTFRITASLAVAFAEAFSAVETPLSFPLVSKLSHLFFKRGYEVDELVLVERTRTVDVGFLEKLVRLCLKDFLS